ncbi:hypothetical protein Dsin_004009 [Dipteronia sinensis]|uniref:Uncharacterized protein n=1 Tax=Dipteronia sinensis TaxID=43782 RepID=A0AAE0BA26_9ROSI|nr:hypothetical protein Dsin_004009 [Dipteronia sinensis]
MPSQLQSALVMPVHTSCQSKVCNFGSEVGIQKNVTGLQVLVDIGRIGVSVEIIEGISNVISDLDSLLPWQSIRSLDLVGVEPIIDSAIVCILVNKVGVAFMETETRKPYYVTVIDLL